MQTKISHYGFEWEPELTVKGKFLSIKGLLSALSKDVDFSNTGYWLFFFFFTNVNAAVSTSPRPTVRPFLLRMLSLAFDLWRAQSI